MTSPRTRTTAAAGTVADAMLWTAWGIAVLVALVRAGGRDEWAAGLAAAFAAVLALAVQTDVIGDPWVAYCVWGLAGTAVPKRLLRAASAAAYRRRA